MRLHFFNSAVIANSKMDYSDEIDFFFAREHAPRPGSHVSVRLGQAVKPREGAL